MAPARPEDETVHVAVATDRTYLPWCAVAVLSCLESTPERHLKIHLLHEGGISAGDERRFAEMVASRGADSAIHVIAADRLSALPSKGDALGGRISWARLVLPELVPDADRIIYLDADTLVVGSVLPLWHTPLDGFVLAAVRNVVEPSAHPHIASLGIADPRAYFNAGILVLNLALMRAERSLDAVFAYVAERGDELSWYDQDALNAVFAGRWLALHPRWNAQNSFWSWTGWAEEVYGRDSLRQAMVSPTILHFEGPSLRKPWHYLSDHPYRDRYRETLAMTPWRDEPLQERTLTTRAIHCLPEQAWLGAYLRVGRYRRAVKRRAARLRLGGT